ncbi:MAG: hypothetical protein HDR72_03420 [Ruminococcaceae bacterium]|nr:hypothetical protein [Oscillospiraceae bacterium]
MKQPDITNSEQAREFYKKYIHDCPRGCDLYDAFTLETLKAYEENSSRELEHRWAFEEFEKYFSQIAPKNPNNPELLKKAWEWRNDDTPVKLVAEKLEIMMNECNGKPDKMLLDCLLVMAGYGEINKNDKSEEQTLVRLMELCRPFVSEEENERLRFKIIGPDSEEETKREYKINGFSDKSNRFQTITAEQNFRRFATLENMLRWKQEYFDELTDKEYFLDKESMYSVNLVELAGLNYGVYSKENTRKLYDKLSGYKNCAAEDQYWHIAYEIVSHLSRRLFEDGEYDMLESFYRLALDMLDNAPDCWDKEYFGSHALDMIEEYRGLIEEKSGGSKM